MKHLSVPIFAILAASNAYAAPLASAPSAVVRLNISDRARTIDCLGKDLTVAGDRNILTISNCAIINVVGNSNRVTAQLLPTSTIAAVGDSNHIVFLHAPGFEVQVTSSGKANEIIPSMGPDASFRSPTSFPLSARPLNARGARQ